MAIVRLWITTLLMFAAIGYYFVEQRIPKLLRVSAVLMAVAWNTYYQLGKLADEKIAAPDVYERAIFLIGGVAVLAGAFKHFAEEVRKSGERLRPKALRIAFSRG